MQEKSKSSAKTIIAYVFLFLISIGIVCAGIVFYDMQIFKALLIGIYVIFAEIIALFSFKAGDIKNSLLQSNSRHPVRFCLFFIISILASFSFTAMPMLAWPFAAIFVLLVMLSNIPTGIIAASVCLIIATGLSSQDFYVAFLLYFIVGITAAILFGNMDESYKIGMPLAISEIVLVCGLFAVSVTLNGSITVEGVMYPFINAAMTAILLLIVLKIYYTKVFFVQKDDYDSINDPENPLLGQLKEAAPEEYRKAIHIAYFCDRIAKRTGMDDNLLKCVGYYHRLKFIGEIDGNKGTLVHIMNCETEFPKDVIEVIYEYDNLSKSKLFTRQETAVLYMAETIVSSVIYLYKKNSEMELDLNTLVDTVFHQRIESGIFNSCKISYGQMEEMKKVFKEEKLYYDFIR